MHYAETINDQVIMKETDRKQAEAAQDAGNRLVARHVREDPFAAAFKATRMPMIVTDPNQADNPIIFCNVAFERLTGYSSSEVVGRNCRFLQGPETNAATGARIRAAISAGSDIAIDILNYKKDGEPFWNALFLSPVRDDGDRIVYFFASQLDFTNVKSREADLAFARHRAEEDVAAHTEKLEAALKISSLLVHEVDHRVKNNLLTMASIVKLQTRITRDEGQKRVLRSVLNRVEALSTVQRKLFTLEDVSRFDVADFTEELVRDLVEAVGRKDIRLTLDLHPLHVPAVKATPLSLIVNELVGDAVRRGLSDGGGDIHVVVKRLNAHFLIRVEDTSIPVEVDEDAAEIGRILIETSAKQVDAKIEKRIDGYRTTVDVTLPVDTEESAH